MNHYTNWVRCELELLESVDVKSSIKRQPLQRLLILRFSGNDLCTVTDVLSDACEGIIIAKENFCLGILYTHLGIQ